MNLKVTSEFEFEFFNPFTESEMSHERGECLELGSRAGRSLSQTKTGQSLWTVTRGEI